MNFKIGYKEEYVEEITTIGKYCDDNPPDDEMTIKQNVAIIKFRQSNPYLKAIFRLEWASSGCGGLLTRPDGIIQTPNYPDSYPLNTRCDWHIQTEFGKSVEVTFDHIDMEIHRNCDLDYIRIINGPDDTYAEVARFCHPSDKPVVFTSTGRDMFITFHSDISNIGKGFHAKYKWVDTKCGGKLTTASGSFHSPNYPNNYDKNDTCEWLIDVQENHLIELTFDSVDLLNICEATFIKVYDGPTAAYPVLKKICGSEKSVVLVSRTNHLYIELVTHALLTTKGFIAHYSTACGARIKTQGSGLIDFNMSTVVTTKVTNCSWTIIAEPPDEHITLTFSKFQNQMCYYGAESSIAIYDGENHNASLIGSYCEKMPGVIRSTGNVLHLEIPESANQQFKFTAEYTVVASGNFYLKKYSIINF